MKAKAQYIGVATGLLRVASSHSTLARNPNGNPSQYYIGVTGNSGLGMLATPLAVPASPWQPRGENASYASECVIEPAFPKRKLLLSFHLDMDTYKEARQILMQRSSAVHLGYLERIKYFFVTVISVFI